MIPVPDHALNSVKNAPNSAEAFMNSTLGRRTQELNGVRRAKEMLGRFGGKSGRHPMQKLMRRMRTICLAVSAARPDLSIYLPALILAGMAACQSWQKQVASVVCEYYKDRIYLPRWRDLPTPVQFAYVLAAALNGQGREQDYTAISLNLTKRLAAMSPADLLDLIRKRLQRALGTNIIFTIELDAAGRAHVHAVYFGNLTPTQRKRLKQAGGEWGGSDSRRQLVCKEKQFFRYALGWTEYMQKGGVLYIPRDMRRAGQVSYEQIRAHVTKVRSNHKSRDPQTARHDAATSTPTHVEKAEVLGQIDPQVSTCHRVGDPFLSFSTRQTTQEPAEAEGGQNHHAALTGAYRANHEPEPVSPADAQVNEPTDVAQDRLSHMEMPQSDDVLVAEQKTRNSQDTSPSPRFVGAHRELAEGSDEMTPPDQGESAYLATSFDTQAHPSTNGAHDDKSHHDELTGPFIASDDWEKQLDELAASIDPPRPAWDYLEELRELISAREAREQEDDPLAELVALTGIAFSQAA